MMQMQGQYQLLGNGAAAVDAEPVKTKNNTGV
jgi:hypothetical protein